MQWAHAKLAAANPPRRPFMAAILTTKSVQGELDDNQS
jgi:hypothetical protein